MLLVYVVWFCRVLRGSLRGGDMLCLGGVLCWVYVVGCGFDVGVCASCARMLLGVTLKLFVLDWLLMCCFFACFVCYT